MTRETAQVFKLPDLGEGLTEAEIVRWLVAIGDEVQIDQAVVEVETAKSVIEVPSPFAGTVAVLHGTEGETVAVGLPLLTVRDASGTAEATDGDAAHDAEAAADAYREEEKGGSGNVLIGYGTVENGSVGRRRRRAGLRVAPGTSVDRVGVVPNPANASAVEWAASHEGRAVPLVISPLVRTLARDNDVDLYLVEPTGRGEVITRADVTRAMEQAVVAASASSMKAGPGRVQAGSLGERRVPMTALRRSVSASLSRSRTEIPEATVWVDVDATALWELRESVRTDHAAGPGLLSYIARFVVAALKQYPVLNARIDTDRQEIVEFASINLGLAVQTQRGLVVPAVMSADTMTTAEMDEAIFDVTQRARDARVTQEELTAGTFTLNNYGGFGVDGSAAIINHPQVAILGFGRIIDRPWVVDGGIVARKVTQMSFVFDHRVCDGATAAGFMRSVADAVESPLAAIARL